jgi:hypothetical protein
MKYMVTKKAKTKTTTVRSHPLKVRVTKKNPTGVTIRDQHLRRLPGTDLNAEEIRSVFEKYDRKGLVYPTKNRLREYPKADLYDDLIAVWSDYFNKKFKADPPLDPDSIKALIASESGFELDPKGNPVAIGIAQITRPTFEILQDPGGEAKAFIFKGIRQKDLKDPEIAIPLAVRWLNRKRVVAESILGRKPNHEEIILSYKGMLMSQTDLKKTALKNYRKHYADLKSR